MRFSNRQLVLLVGAALLAGYLVLVYAQVDQQALPDFAAFYAVAQALGHGGLGAAHQLYSLAFQIRAESIFSRGAHQSYLEPFVDLPPAALVVLPFTLLPLWPSFFLWDSIGLGLCLLGAIWLARQERLGRDALPVAVALVASYPTYEALGEGQYDLLWPLCLALITAAWYTSSVWQRWLRTAAAAFLFTFKPDLLILAVVPAAAAWRRSVVREAVACLVALAALCVAVIGVPGLLRLPSIESYTLFHRFPPSLDETVLGFFWHLTGHGQLTRGISYAAIAVALAAFAYAWWRNPPRSATDWRLALSCAVCLSLLVAPHALNHDLLLLVGPGVWTAAALRSAGRDLRWLTFWVVLFNVATLIDASPRVSLPVPLVPLVLLAAALAAWRARATLAPAPAPVPQPEPLVPAKVPSLEPSQPLS